jgi:glucuronoarabinoxylan endo-1,4-beta-xylanase
MVGKLWNIKTTRFGIKKGPPVFAAILLILLLGCSSKNVGNNNNNNNGNNTTVNAEVTILSNDNKQVIQGFGCATVFSPPNTSALTNEEFDRLFGSGNGQVGLNILRIRVATDNSWRTTELNHAKEAIQRGAKVIASPWSPPAHLKTNNSLIGGSLIADSGASYARYLNDFADYMASNGATLYAVSVQNEPDISVNYESCNWTADAMRNFLKNHGHLITSTNLIAPESFNNNLSYVNTILNDAGAAANVDIVGGHIYGSGIVENAVAKNLNKEVWMTEHLDTNITYTASINTAVEIHDCLTKANFNAYIWWYGKRFYGPVGQDGMVTKRGYALAQFARFIKPGSVRLGTSNNSRPEVLVSAYKNGNKKIIVAINPGIYDVNQKFTIQDAAISEVIPFTTTLTKNAEQAAKLTVTNNSFSYVLPSNSIVTFLEQ